MTANIGTVSWIAPEIFAKKTYSEKADVYSFGIIMWELVTRVMPFGDVEPFSVPLLVTNGSRPPVPKDCPKDFARLIGQAWHQKPHKRPKFEELEHKLKRMKLDWRDESKRLGKLREEDPVTKLTGTSEEHESVSESHSHSHSQYTTSTTTTTTELNDEDDSDKGNYSVSSGGNSEKSSGNASNLSISTTFERRKSRKSSHGKITVRKRQ